MLANNYIQLKVQKALLHGVAGCIEHTTSHWEMLQNAKAAERQIAIAWLDLEMPMVRSGTCLHSSLSSGTMCQSV